YSVQCGLLNNLDYANSPCTQFLLAIWRSGIKSEVKWQHYNTQMKDLIEEINDIIESGPFVIDSEPVPEADPEMEAWLNDILLNDELGFEERQELMEEQMNTN